MTSPSPTSPEDFTTSHSIDSITRPFLWTIALVLGIFFGYEILEQAWLNHAYPEWIDVLHIVRGVGTALIVGVFLLWYFFTKKPHITARQIFVSSVRSEGEHNRQMRRNLGEWFTRFRWIVTAVFILGLILLITGTRDILWQDNFLLLMVLGAVMVVTNSVYVFLQRQGISYGRQLPAQIAVDFLFITVFLHYTGGIENPAYVLYFIHVMVAGVILSTLGAWLCTAGAIILFSGLVLAEYGGYLPHYSSVLYPSVGGNPFNNINFITAVLLVFSGVSLGMTYFTSLVVNSLRRYRRRLLSEKSRSEQLLEKLFNVREEERARVSRELHDQIGQSLSAIRLKIQNSSRESAEPYENLGDDVEDAIDEVRDLSHQLRPPSLDECGLPCAIENYAEEIQANYDINVDYEYVGLDHSRNFSIALDTAMYRIAQEAVRNAVEHGKPNNISLILQKSTEVLQLMVEDDGRGFDDQIIEKKGRETLGIQGMKERVQLLGGTFILESTPRDGTRVRAEIPVNGGGER